MNEFATATFGDLVADVAVEAPISRTRLDAAVNTLASVSRRSEQELRSIGEVVIEAPEASVVRLPVDTWNRLEAEANLLPVEAVAVREVHRQFVTALTGGRYVTEPRTDPLVIPVVTTY